MTMEGVKRMVDIWKVSNNVQNVSVRMYPQMRRCVRFADILWKCGPGLSRKGCRTGQGWSL